MKKVILIGFVLVAVMTNCASKTKYINTADLPDTYQCDYMKEICKEAQDFQRKYSQMSEEDKRESKTILNAYIDQCSNAQDLCEKSAKQESN